MGKATVELVTTGMHCGSCAMLIDMTVGDLPGVESSTTSHAAGTTVVVFDDEVTSVDVIVESIRSVGYEASISA